MAGQKREARLRARCPGYPRISSRDRRQDVDARDEPGHDERSGGVTFRVHLA
jgi:hypothetical protein